MALLVKSSSRLAHLALAISLVLFITLVPLVFMGLVPAAETQRSSLDRPQTYTVVISIQGLPKSYSTNLFLDGQRMGSYRGGLSRVYDFTAGRSHTISVDPIVNASAGVRYYCSPNTVKVSGAGSYAFNYRAQYFLTMNTMPSDVPIETTSSWYDSGASVTTNTAPSSIDVAPSTKYVFQTWKLDGSPIVGNPVTVVMNSPHTVTVVYVSSEAYSTTTYQTSYVETSSAAVAQPSFAGSQVYVAMVIVAVILVVAFIGVGLKRRSKPRTLS